MRDYGYIEGRNLRLEIRWADGKLDRLPALARELAEAGGLTIPQDLLFRADRVIE